MVLYFERVQHASALDTGWRLLPALAVYVAVSAVADRLVRRSASQDGKRPGCRARR